MIILTSPIKFVNNVSALEFCRVNQMKYDRDDRLVDERMDDPWNSFLQFGHGSVCSATSSSILSLAYGVVFSHSVSTSSVGWFC